MAAHAAVLVIDLRIPASRSLKDRRAAVRPVLDGARRRFGVSVAEVSHQQLWQRAEVAFAGVGSSVGGVEELLAAVERFVWSFPDLEVLDVRRRWVDLED